MHQHVECFIFPPHSCAPNPFTFKTVTVSHLKSLDVTKSIYRIRQLIYPPDYLKRLLIRYIATPLIELFNNSLQTSTGDASSESMEMHKVRLSYNPMQFQSIAVVSTLTKMLEKIMSDQLGNYFESKLMIYSTHIREPIAVASQLKICYWLLLTVLYIYQTEVKQFVQHSLMHLTLRSLHPFTATI